MGNWFVSPFSTVNVLTIWIIFHCAYILHSLCLIWGPTFLGVWQLKKVALNVHFISLAYQTIQIQVIQTLNSIVLTSSGSHWQKGATFSAKLWNFWMGRLMWVTPFDEMWDISQAFIQVRIFLGMPGRSLHMDLQIFPPKMVQNFLFVMFLMLWWQKNLKNLLKNARTR